jgi:hypothetical protein
MKFISIHSVLLAGNLFLASGVQASDAVENGDLCVVFYQLDSSNVVGPDHYVVNMGPASQFRENTQNNVAVSTINSGLASGNIGADLSATFGPTWHDDGTLRWMVVGSVQATAPSPVNGDPARTNYYSVSRGSLNTSDFGPNSSIQAFTSTNRGNLTTNLYNFLIAGGVNDAINGINGNTSTSGANVASVIIPTSQTRSVDEYLPPTTTTSFAIATDPRQTLNSGTIGGTAGVQGALDIYRILHTTTGADLTAGASGGNAVVGTAQFIGALTLDQTGNLKIQAVGSTAGSFSSWASANNVTGGKNGDSDLDGISNLVEYALDLDPEGSDGAAGDFSGGAITFTKRAEAVTNGDVTYAIQESDDLGVTDVWQTVTPTSDTATTISYTLPTGSSKKFARLIINTVP